MNTPVHTEGEELLLRHRIDELSKRMRTAEERLDSLQKSAYTELLTAELIKKDIAFIKSGMEDMLGTLNSLVKAPSKRWNQAVTALISSAVAAVSALIFT